MKTERKSRKLLALFFWTSRKRSMKVHSNNKSALNYVVGARQFLVLLLLFLARARVCVYARLSHSVNQSIDPYRSTYSLLNNNKPIEIAVIIIINMVELIKSRSIYIFSNNSSCSSSKHK